MAKTKKAPVQKVSKMNGHYLTKTDSKTAVKLALAGEKISKIGSTYYKEVSKSDAKKIQPTKFGGNPSAKQMAQRLKFKDKYTKKK